MHRHATICILILSLAALIGPKARADTIVTPYSFTLIGTGTALDTLAITPFDTSLGTLNEVLVEIQAGLVITADVASPTNLIVELDFTGLGGDLFNFSPPAVLAWELVSPPGTVIPISFDSSFRFTAASDPTGIATGVSFSGVVTPPVSIVGTRADFQNALGVNMLDVLLTGGADFFGGGAIFITYDYTPGVDPNVVPLPSAAAGGMTLLAMLASARRKRR